MEYLSCSFVLLFGLVEFIFTFQVLNFRNRPDWNIMLYKVATAAIAIIGSILVLNTSITDANTALLFSGSLPDWIEFYLVNKYSYSQKPNNWLKAGIGTIKPSPDLPVFSLPTRHPANILHLPKSTARYKLTDSVSLVLGWKKDQRREYKKPPSTW